MPNKKFSAQFNFHFIWNSSFLGRPNNRQGKVQVSLPNIALAYSIRIQIRRFKQNFQYQISNFEWKTWTVDHHMWYNIGRRLFSDPFCQQLTNGRFHRNQSCISSFWLKNCPWIMSARLVSEHCPGGGNVRSSFDAIISTNKEMNFKFFNSRKKQHLQQLLIKN